MDKKDGCLLEADVMGQLFHICEDGSGGEVFVTTTLLGQWRNVLGGAELYGAHYKMKEWEIDQGTKTIKKAIPTMTMTELELAIWN